MHARRRWDRHCSAGSNSGGRTFTRGQTKRSWGVRDANEIDRAITAFVRGPNDGLLVTNNNFVIVHRDVIIELEAR
jgi:hypothetical protein